MCDNCGKKPVVADKQIKCARGCVYTVCANCFSAPATKFPKKCKKCGSIAPNYSQVFVKSGGGSSGGGSKASSSKVNYDSDSSSSGEADGVGYVSEENDDEWPDDKDDKLKDSNYVHPGDSNISAEKKVRSADFATFYDKVGKHLELSKNPDDWKYVADQDFTNGNFTKKQYHVRRQLWSPQPVNMSYKESDPEFDSDSPPGDSYEIASGVRNNELERFSSFWAPEGKEDYEQFPHFMAIGSKDEEGDHTVHFYDKYIQYQDKLKFDQPVYKIAASLKNNLYGFLSGNTEDDEDFLLTIAKMDDLDSPIHKIDLGDKSTQLNKSIEFYAASDIAFDCHEANKLYVLDSGAMDGVANSTSPLRIFDIQAGKFTAHLSGHTIAKRDGKSYFIYPKSSYHKPQVVSDPHRPGIVYTFGGNGFCIYDLRVNTNRALLYVDRQTKDDESIYHVPDSNANTIVNADKRSIAFYDIRNLKDVGKTQEVSQKFNHLSSKGDKLVAVNANKFHYFNLGDYEELYSNKGPSSKKLYSIKGIRWNGRGHYTIGEDLDYKINVSIANS